jgi:hypothetical protein
MGRIGTNSGGTARLRRQPIDRLLIEPLLGGRPDRVTPVPLSARIALKPLFFLHSGGDTRDLAVSPQCKAGYKSPGPGLRPTQSSSVHRLTSR